MASAWNTVLLLGLTAIILKKLIRNRRHLTLFITNIYRTIIMKHKICLERHKNWHSKNCWWHLNISWHWLIIAIYRYIKRTWQKVDNGCTIYLWNTTVKQTCLIHRASCGPTFNPQQKYTLKAINLTSNNLHS